MAGVYDLMYGQNPWMQNPMQPPQQQWGGVLGYAGMPNVRVPQPRTPFAPGAQQQQPPNAMPNMLMPQAQNPMQPNAPWLQQANGAPAQTPGQRVGNGLQRLNAAAQIAAPTMQSAGAVTPLETAQPVQPRQEINTTFGERWSSPMGPGSNLAPSDMVSLGMQMMGAAQPSWNINQPNGWTQAGNAIQNTMERADERALRNEDADWMREQRGWARSDRPFEVEQQGWARDRQGWDRTAHEQEQADRQQALERYNTALQSAQGNPEQLSLLQAAGPQHFFEAIQGEREMAWRSREGALDRGNQYAIAALRQNQERNPSFAGNEGVRAREAMLALPLARERLADVVNLMGRMSDGELASQVGARNGAFYSSLRQLQLQLKETNRLGALSGPDQELLQALTGDPSAMWTYLHRGGREGMQGALGQLATDLDRSERYVYQTYAPYSQAREVADLYQQQQQRMQGDSSSQQQQGEIDYDAVDAELARRRNGGGQRAARSSPAQIVPRSASEAPPPGYREAYRQGRGGQSRIFVRE